MRVLTCVLVAGVALLLSTSAGRADSVDGVSVTAVDAGGTSLDVPYYLQGGLVLVGAVEEGVGAEVPMEVPDFSHPRWQAVDGGNMRIWTPRDDTCGSFPWPSHTEGPYSVEGTVGSACWDGEVDGSQSAAPAVWVVRVPLAATTAAGSALIFDHWTADVPGDRCRTGDMGKVENWRRLTNSDIGPGNVVESAPGSFSVGAEYRFWGGFGGVTAHYVLASATDATAPLIEVTAPIDCQPVEKDATVPAQFSCDDQGGSGVASCLGTIDGATATIKSGDDLDTSTAGSHTLTITAKDTKGNTRTRTLSYLVDGQAPTLGVSATPAAPDAGTGWYTAAQVGAGNELPVTVSASDESGGSGIGSPIVILPPEPGAGCSLDGNSIWSFLGFPVDRTAKSIVWQTPDPQVFTIPQGTHTLSCSALDWAGHTTAKSQTYKVDTNPPPATDFFDLSYPSGDGREYTCPAQNPFGTGPATYVAGQQVSIQWFLHSTDDGTDGSGLVSPTTTTGFVALDTTTAGEHVTNAPSTADAAGNVTSGPGCQYFVVDTTPPTDSPTVTGTTGNNGWYRSDVTVSWHWTDPGSGIDTANCSQTSTTSGEGSAVTASSTCKDLSGNSNADSRTFKIDETAPTFTPSLGAGRVFALGANAPAVSLTGLTDPGADASGIASSSCGTVDTSSIGKKTVSCTATDNAGNPTTKTVTYYVTYGFGGFQAPLPKSTVKQGSSIPVKFTLANSAGSTFYANVAGVRVVLTGPASATASCPYSTKVAAYQCQLSLPKTAGTYVLTAQQQVGTDWVALPDAATVSGKSNANGEIIALK